MSRLLRLVACAAPLLLLVSATEEEFIRFSIPSTMHFLNGGPELLQSQINITDSIRVVNIPITLFSTTCGQLLSALNQEGNGGPVGNGEILRAQYIDLVVSIYQQCVIPDLLPPDDISDNEGDLVVINASPCSEVSNLLQSFESNCAAAISAAPPTVCDLTFCQNFFFDQPGNSIEATICYDVYYCFPDSCSADDVERLGAFVMTALNEDEEVDETGQSVFGAWSTCPDAAGRVRDFNGGEEAFITDLTISGTGTAADVASSIVISVESPVSSTPLVDGVVCKITEDLAGEDWAKACCGQLNLNEDFRSLYMYCDVSERSGSPYNMSIYSPFDNIDVLCQADLDAQDNQPSNQQVQQCTNFIGTNTVGISLSGETIPFNAEQMPTEVLPTTAVEEIPVIEDQTLPPQIITGNGPAPPLIQILNGPDAGGVSSTRPAFLALVACALVAFLSSRV